MTEWDEGLLIAYNQIRTHEETKEMAAMMGAQIKM